jgi:hypothetical protein
MLKIRAQNIQILKYCVLLTLISVLVGCASPKYQKLEGRYQVLDLGLSEELNILKIKTRISREGQYKEYKTIKERDLIISVRNILNKAYWINAQVLIEPPLYKLELGSENTNSFEPEVFGLLYKPNSDQFEVLYQGKQLFGVLSKEDTKTLEQIIK